MATYCGECQFFKYEDTDGYGLCDISGLEENCSLVCDFDKQGELTNEQAIKVLHHAQKWRRGAKIGMPPPALLGLAIDTGIRVLRQKIKEEKVEDACRWLNTILCSDPNTEYIRVNPLAYKSKKEIIDGFRRLMQRD